MLDIVAVYFILDSAYLFIPSFLFLILVAVFIRPKKYDPFKVFIRVLVLTAVFLFIIHLVRIRPDFSITWSLWPRAAVPFGRICMIFGASLFLMRSIKSEVLFAAMIDMKIQRKLIYLLFNPVWLLPAVVERGKTILEAQQARGLDITLLKNKAVAYTSIVIPLVTSMIGEQEENLMSNLTRGFFIKGKKTHISNVPFNIMNIVVLIGVTLLCILLVAIGRSWA